MTPQDVQAKIQEALQARPSFVPVAYGIVVPRTALGPSGRYGQFRFLSRRKDAVTSAGFLRGCERLAEFGGYVRINGGDKSSLFIDFANEQGVHSTQFAQDCKDMAEAITGQ